MKVFAFCQVLNEGVFIRRNLMNVYDHVDKIILTEGKLTPFANNVIHDTSTDNTVDEIVEFAKTDPDDKLNFMSAITAEECSKSPGNREWWEGQNKNGMLAIAIKLGLEPGDLIYIMDADEFIPQEKLDEVVKGFEVNEWMQACMVHEYQFAYGLQYYFLSSHPRFFRYSKGAKFTTTNHFVVPDVGDLSRKTNTSINGMFHLCWSKHPNFIREKVLSFNRPSFTRWFNDVYLVWPRDPAQAYTNNTIIPPYHGTGFAEGMNKQLSFWDRDIMPAFPEVLQDIDNMNWLEYVKEHEAELRI